MASPVKLQGVGPGGFQGSDLRPGLDHRRQRLRRRHRSWPPTGTTKLGTLTWDGNQDVNDGEGDLRPRLAERHHGRGPGAPVHQRLQGQHRRLRHPRRRPAGLPGQHQRPDRRPDRAAAQHHHPGRRDLRQRLRPQPADHQQRGRRTTAAATARSGSARPTCRRRTPTSTTRTSGSPTTGSSPTPAPTWPAASGSSPGRTATRSPATTSAATSRLEYGGGVSVYGRSPNGKIHHNRIYFNQSNDEGGGIMIAGQLPADPDRRSRRAPARSTSTPTRSRPTCPTTTAAASGS